MNRRRKPHRRGRNTVALPHGITGGRSYSDFVEEAAADRLPLEAHLADNLRTVERLKHVRQELTGLSTSHGPLTFRVG